MGALGMGAGLGGSAMVQAAVVGNKSSVRAAGFLMPLESDPHERTFMQWPTRVSIYGSQRALDAVRGKIALIAQSIAAFEPVVVLASPNQVEAARKALGPKVEVWSIETEDLWCRDSGPTFVRSAKGDIAVSELNFNGWGNKQGTLTMAALPSGSQHAWGSLSSIMALLAKAVAWRSMVQVPCWHMKAAGSTAIATN